MTAEAPDLCTVTHLCSPLILAIIPAVWHVLQSTCVGSVRDVSKFHLRLQNVAVSNIHYLWMIVC
jgi:hypothetical protein